VFQLRFERIEPKPDLVTRYFPLKTENRLPKTPICNLILCLKQGCEFIVRGSSFHCAQAAFSSITEERFEPRPLPVIEVASRTDEELYTLTRVSTVQITQRLKTAVTACILLQHKLNS
jgi:hypothetical protein